MYSALSRSCRGQGCSGTSSLSVVRDVSTALVVALGAGQIQLARAEFESSSGTAGDASQQENAPRRQLMETGLVVVLVILGLALAGGAAFYYYKFVYLPNQWWGHDEWGGGQGYGGDEWGGDEWHDDGYGYEEDWGEDPYAAPAPPAPAPVVPTPAQSRERGKGVKGMAPAGTVVRMEYKGSSTSWKGKKGTKGKQETMRAGQQKGAHTWAT
ncbi:unnamed protein product [Amoebophrya sp. A120]|nr:unnamed protein product [Amoebophrya sp. A120]|eukprot:GSA120T00008364001.1